MSLFSELKRRNVLRVAIAYLAVAWLLIQVVETLFPVFELSDASIRLVVILLAIGFPLILVLSWVYELTPQGLLLDREVDRSTGDIHHTGKKLDRAIIVVLALAVGYFAVDEFVFDAARNEEIAQQLREEGAQQAREEARLEAWNEKSIAVLPFANHSMREEDKSFTNGMHDELLTRLSRVSALKVISRTSVMLYSDTSKTLPEIARELSVSTVMQGGVQRSGDQVRINVQLIDAHTDEQIWGDTFDRELTAENLFAIQSEITTAIAAELDAVMSPAEESRVYELPTANMDAYNHFLRGRQFMAGRHTDDLDNALAEFEQATTFDPGFALAWVGIADAIRFLNQRSAASSDLRTYRKEAIDKALALDDQLGEAYVSRSDLNFEEGRHEEALADCMKGIELSPNYWRGYMQCGGMIGRKGPEFREQRQVMYYKAGQLDPLSMPIQNMLGRVFTGLGRYDEARDVFDHMLQLDPDFAPTYGSVRELHQGVGDLAEAVKWGREAFRRDPENGLFRSNLAQMYFSLSLVDPEFIERVPREIYTQLDPESFRSYWLEFNTDFARGTLNDIPGVIERLPEETAESWYMLAFQANMAFLRGDLEKSYEYWLRAEPRWDDPDQWEELIGANETGNDRLHACKFASIMIDLGDEARGQDLLRRARFFSEVTLPGIQEDSHRSTSLGWCYLAAGEYTLALDFYRERAEHGHYSGWWKERHLPWWDALREDDRYIAMVNLIESQLQEQRELLRQMDDQL